MEEVGNGDGIEVIFEEAPESWSLDEAGMKRALTNLLVIAVINLIIGLQPGIDNWGHIGGLIGGTLYAWFAGPILEVKGIYPNMTLVDERPAGDVVRTTFSVGLLFGALAVVTIFLRN